MNNRLRKILSLIVGAFFILFILFMIFRNPLLHWGINKTSTQIKQRTGAILEIKSASFSGFLSISMHDISLIPLEGDTILKADNVKLRISFWTLFGGVIRVKELFSSGINLTVSCRNSICNYSGFIHEKHATTSTTELNYSILFKKLLDRAFNLAPQIANLQNISFTYKNDTLKRSFRINEFHSDENSLYGLAEDLETHSIWKCNGFFSQTNRSLYVKFFPIEGQKSKLPMSRELLGLTIGFDTVNVALNGYDWARNLLKVNGKISIDNLSAYHKKLSDDTIKVISASFNFSVNSGKSYIEIDSSSTAFLEAIKMNTFLKYSKENDIEYSLMIKTDKINATDFFKSLPEGMFDEVHSIKADGTLQYSLNFKIDTHKPDSLFFESSMKKDHFRIKSFGKSDLMKMNGEFTHSVYEKDRFIRSFEVGYSNPYFTSLDNISPSFINSVLTSEDGSFFYHNGFNEDAFRKSIITNFREKKFSRGGSTISMQLVKNVFLNRKKTIARKAEEAMIVWLIESNRLYPKKRMLEVYMNIIELGPGIYGIGEASEFYFKKPPRELTLPEGIFLASLLPHPKWFKYSFDTLGNLKPYLADYYRIVSDFMLKKNLISQEEHDQLKPYVVLNGPARNMVIPTDTIPEEGEEQE